LRRGAAYEETRMKRKTKTIYQSDLFQDDGIHLNCEGQRIWRDRTILPAIEQLIRPFDLVHLCREG